MPKIATGSKQSTSGGIVVGSGLQTAAVRTGTWQSTGLTQAGKPLKVKLVSGPTTTASGEKKRPAQQEESKVPSGDQNDSQSLSQFMNEETKQAQASRHSQALEKMQGLQAAIMNSRPNADADDAEHDDEFDSYMENALMQEANSLGIFADSEQAAGENVYQEALKRVEQEVAKVPPTID